MRNSHDKSIIVKRSKEDTSKNPRFKKKDFDVALDSMAYDIELEKMIKCPCHNRATASPRPDCLNCGGSGYVFIDKKETTCMISGINRDTKYKNWSEVNRGTVNLSFKDDDRIGFMDKVKNLNILSLFLMTCV